MTTAWLALTALCVGLAALGVFVIVGRRRRRAVGVPSTQKSLRQPVSAARVLSISLIAFGAGATAFLFTGVVGIALGASSLGALLLPVLDTRRRSRLASRVESAYPDIIEGLISRVRSGGRLLESLADAAATGPVQLARPAEEFWRSVQVSGDASACLDELKRRWGSPTGDLLIETVRVAYDVGGNRVIEVLRELADQIRRDRNVRREVAAKQSWVRVAARVGVAAPWVVLVLLSFRSEATAAYNSPEGIALIVCGLGLSLAAYRLMTLLGRMPVPERLLVS